MRRRLILLWVMLWTWNLAAQDNASGFHVFFKEPEAIHVQLRKWLNQQLKILFDLLAARPELGTGRRGSMLDHSLVLVVTEIAQAFPQYSNQYLQQTSDRKIRSLLPEMES